MTTNDEALKIRLSDMIKPKRVEVESSAEDGAYGKFVAEPLERGFGLTIGNALRRVLLSHLEGAAITSVKIEGVPHEFDTITGVSEDVAEIILNLKEVVVSLQDKDQAIMRMSISKDGEVKASDFEADPAITIVNPAQHIATLSNGANLEMEVEVRRGRGYCTAEANRVEGAPQDTIFIDSSFSPIRMVNLNTTAARVGQRTDYDKLVLDVWTNGSISPRVAVSEAATIIHSQLELFVGDGLIQVEQEVVEEVPANEVNENLFRRIEELELSVRSANCLENADIKYIGELVARSEAEMLRTKNFGKKSLTEIRAILTKMNLELGMDMSDLPPREELDRIAREGFGSRPAI